MTESEKKVMANTLEKIRNDLAYLHNQLQDEYGVDQKTETIDGIVIAMTILTDTAIDVIDKG